MKRLLIMFLTLTLSACATVPANSPHLNQKVSEGILRLKQQHFVTLDKLYKMSLKKVNDDYDSIYAKATSIFEKKNGRAPSSEADFKVVSIIAAGIREDIIEKVRANHNEIKAAIEKNYDLVSSVNNEVTAYLYSAVRLAKARSETTALIDKLTGIDLNLDKMFVELDEKIESAIAEEIKR